MKRLITSIAILIITTSSMVAWGNPSLSRSDAKKQINSNSKIIRYKLNVPLHSGAYKMGKEQGIWKYQNRKTLLAKKAKSSIASVSRNTITLHNPAQINIEVTGIASVPMMANMKEAQFSWKYQKLPHLVRRFALEGGGGSAFFRLFDDGWRLENIKIKTSNIPIQLSPKEWQEAVKDAETEQVRKKQELKAQREEQERANRNKLARLNKIIVAGITSGKPLKGSRNGHYDRHFMIKSYNENTGALVGTSEHLERRTCKYGKGTWCIQNAINRIEGSLSGATLILNEVEVIQPGIYKNPITKRVDNRDGKLTKYKLELKKGTTMRGCFIEDGKPTCWSGSWLELK